jgi:hypothetical protein
LIVHKPLTRVKIKAPGVEGAIRRVIIDPQGVMYEVQYWNQLQRVTDSFYAEELEILEANPKTIGFHRSPK